MKELAPVALFVYNRLSNTRRTVEHLLANSLAQETELYVFSDGGKDHKSWKKVNEIRTYFQNVKQQQEGKGFKKITLIERSENLYLERNIIEGIHQIFETHDRIIVLEDDICTSPYYLDYMNTAFKTYYDMPTVMHISGFTNLDMEQENDIYFTPHMSGWGWGTWRNRWQKYFCHYSSRKEALKGLTPKDLKQIEYDGVFPCLKSLDKQPIPWDICWEIAIYKQRGLCLTPCRTLVRNIGLYNGTHFQNSRLLQHFNYDRMPLQRPIQIEHLPPIVNPQIEALFKESIIHWGIRYTPLGRIVRYFYLLIFSNKK